MTKKKTVLKKLVLKVNKINDLNTRETKGGARTNGARCTPPYTDAYPSQDTSAVICVC